MVFTLTWSEIVPADTDLANQLGLFIRNTKTAVEERMNLEHVWPSTDVANTGKHRQGSAKVYTNLVATPPANDPLAPGSLWIPLDSLAVRVDNGTAWIAVTAGADCVRAFNSTGLTIPSAGFGPTATPFTFDSEQFDTNNLHSNSLNNGRLTAVTPGKYCIGVDVGIAQHSEPTTGYIDILLNGSTITGGRVGVVTVGDPAWVSVSVLYLLAAGDYVTASMLHNSFTSISLLTVPIFWMFKVA